MEKTNFRVEVLFGDILNEDTISSEQKTKMNNFLNRSDVKIKTSGTSCFYLNLEKEKFSNMNRVILLLQQNQKNSKKTDSIQT